MVDRAGISVGELSESQRDLFFSFLASLLGNAGYKYVGGIMAAESLLNKDKRAKRLEWFPENYWFAIFRTPSHEKPWAWQFGGHHLTINMSIENNKIISMSPTFIGSEPAKFAGDINAIIHCHSPWVRGYASTDIEIPCLAVQTTEKIGRIPLIPLSPFGGPQTEQEISPVLKDPKVVAAVLANHGTIGVGSTLMKALYMAEIIEETAHIAFVRDIAMLAHSKGAVDMPIFGTVKDARASV